PRHIDIYLRMRKLQIEGGLECRSPGQRLAVGRSMTDIGAHIERQLLGNDAWIDPRAGGELVPEVVALLIKLCDVLSRRALGLGYIVHHLLREHCLDRNIYGSDFDSWPVGT